MEGSEDKITTLAYVEGEISRVTYFTSYTTFIHHSDFNKELPINASFIARFWFSTLVHGRQTSAMGLVTAKDQVFCYAWMVLEDHFWGGVEPLTV